MAVSPVLRRFVPPASVVVLVGLAGCSGTTYGTGVSAEEQTMKDVMSLASLGSNDPPPIDYKPRGGIVAPPTANLPPPGTASAATASAAEDPNWPKDPDAAKRKKAEEEAQASANSPVPNFILPKGKTSYDVATTESTDQTRAEGKAAWDALHKGKAGSYDAQGNPTRKYLTEPPVAYREPDPNQPMKEPPKSAAKKWDLSKLWPF
ncbi:hypothetical protein C3941_10405 [Kaistia algarum]|uniref:hypothetical protein n=1 Tax=Kaistia algarum TaxID=2083279 RepID=UPI000CE9128F|nr:hypothetical protein [Kaistia algarum]MCX5512468.1 hypothetical protein [Kaistia algarum]PPE80546.1 hypothetical protein C3941_10405 [Kaistia algarum]